MILSIIIVNYRTWDCLENCLHTLTSNVPRQSWEIIVVDNQSADGKLSEFAARFPGVHFTESRWNGGFAHGCNLGAKPARGRCLLFLNPDVIAERGSIQALLDIKHANPDVAVLTASQVDDKGRLRKVFDVFSDKLTWFPTVKFLMRILKPGRFPNPRRPFTGLLDCDWVSGSVFMIDRTDFDLLNGWRNEYWMYSEDRDFCFRARGANKRVACTGDVRLIHSHGGASRQNLSISILTRTEVIISKHLFIHLNYHDNNEALNHLCVFLAVVPRLLLCSFLDLITLRHFVVLNTRTGVLCGLFRHYFHAHRSRTWRSSQVVSGER